MSARTTQRVNINEYREEGVKSANGVLSTICVVSLDTEDIVLKGSSTKQCIGGVITKCVAP